MIKLKDILLESTAPDIFIPRRIEDRENRYDVINTKKAELYVKEYIDNGIKGDLNLSFFNLSRLPSNLKNVNVGRNFFCYGNNLTSLINSPKTDNGHFNCYDNKLTSLVGAPEYVGGDFNCVYNNLTSLEGAPKSVGNSFVCYKNPVKFTEKDIRAVCDVKGNVYV